MTAEGRIAFAISCLRESRKMALADCRKFGPDDHLTIMQQSRADAYEYAIALLDENSPEAAQWDFKVAKQSNAEGKD